MPKKKPPAEVVPATAPPPGRPEGKTKPVRTFEMVAEWVYWISEVTGESQAAVVDPWVRGPAFMRYKELEPEITRLKELRRQADEIKRKAKEGG